MENASFDFETALLSTNTPNLPVSAIAERVRLPERFMEQHWLNPPHLLPLCEIVAGEKTSERNVRQMREWVAALRKCPVMVKDIPGFLINCIQGEPWSGSARETPASPPVFPDEQQKGTRRKCRGAPLFQGLPPLPFSWLPSMTESFSTRRRNSGEEENSAFKNRSISSSATVAPTI